MPTEKELLSLTPISKETKQAQEINQSTEQEKVYKTSGFKYDLSDKRLGYVKDLNLNNIQTYQSSSNNWLEENAGKNQSWNNQLGNAWGGFLTQAAAGFTSSLGSLQEMIEAPAEFVASGGKQPDYTNSLLEAGSAMLKFSEDNFKIYDANVDWLNWGDVGRMFQSSGLTAGIALESMAETAIMGLLAAPTGGASAAAEGVSLASKANLLRRIFQGGKSLEKASSMSKILALDAKMMLHEGFIEAKEVVDNTRQKLIEKNNSLPEGERKSQEEIEQLARGAGTNVVLANAAMALTLKGAGKMIPTNNVFSKFVDKISGTSVSANTATRWGLDAASKKVFINSTLNNFQNVPEELFQESLNANATDSAFRKVNWQSNELGELWNDGQQLIQIAGGALMGGAITNTAMNRGLGNSAKGERDLITQKANTHVDLLSRITAINGEGELRKEALYKTALKSNPNLTTEQLEADPQYQEIAARIDKGTNTRTAILFKELDNKTDYISDLQYQESVKAINENKELSADQKTQALGLFEEQYKAQKESKPNKFGSFVAQHRSDIDALNMALNEERNKPEAEVNNTTIANLENAIKAKQQHLKDALRVKDIYDDTNDKLSDENKGDLLELVNSKIQHEQLSEQLSGIRSEKSKYLNDLDISNNFTTDLESLDENDRSHYDNSVKEVANNILIDGLNKQIETLNKEKENKQSLGEKAQYQKKINELEQKKSILEKENKEITRQLHDTSKNAINRARAEKIDGNFLELTLEEQQTNLEVANLEKNLNNFYSKENRNTRRANSLAMQGVDKVKEELKREKKPLIKNSDYILKLEKLLAENEAISNKVNTSSTVTATKSNTSNNSPAANSVVEAHSKMKVLMTEFKDNKEMSLEQMKLALQEVLNAPITSSQSIGEIVSIVEEILNYGKAEFPIQIQNLIDSLIKRADKNQPLTSDSAITQIKLLKEFMSSSIQKQIDILEAKIAFFDAKTLLNDNDTTDAETQLNNKKKDLLKNYSVLFKEVKDFVNKAFNKIIDSLEELVKLNPKIKSKKERLTELDKQRELILEVQYQTEILTEFLDSLTGKPSVDNKPLSTKTKEIIEDETIPEESKPILVKSASESAGIIDHSVNENQEVIENEKITPKEDEVVSEVVNTTEINQEQQPTSTTQSNIEAKKADIKRRRQEELKALEQESIPSNEAPIELNNGIDWEQITGNTTPEGMEEVFLMAVTNSVDDNGNVNTTKEIKSIIGKFLEGDISYIQLAEELSEFNLQSKQYNNDEVLSFINLFINNPRYSNIHDDLKTISLMFVAAPVLQKQNEFTNTPTTATVMGTLDPVLPTGYTHYTGNKQAKTEHEETGGGYKTVTTSLKSSNTTTQYKRENGKVINTGEVNMNVSYNPTLALNHQIKEGQELVLSNDKASTEEELLSNVVVFAYKGNSYNTSINQLLQKGLINREAFNAFVSKDEAKWLTFSEQERGDIISIVPIFFKLNNEEHATLEESIKNRIGFVPTTGWFTNNNNFEEKNPGDRKLAEENNFNLRQEFVQSHFNSVKSGKNTPFTVKVTKYSKGWINYVGNATETNSEDRANIKPISVLHSNNLQLAEVQDNNFNDATQFKHSVDITDIDTGEKTRIDIINPVLAHDVNLDKRKEFVNELINLLFENKGTTSRSTRVLVETMFSNYNGKSKIIEFIGKNGKVTTGFTKQIYAIQFKNNKGELVVLNLNGEQSEIDKNTEIFREFVNSNFNNFRTPTIRQSETEFINSKVFDIFTKVYGIEIKKVYGEYGSDSNIHFKSEFEKLNYYSNVNPIYYTSENGSTKSSIYINPVINYTSNNNIEVSNKINYKEATQVDKKATETVKKELEKTTSTTTATTEKTSNITTTEEVAKVDDFIAKNATVINSVLSSLKYFVKELENDPEADILNKFSQLSGLASFEINSIVNFVTAELSNGKTKEEIINSINKTIENKRAELNKLIEELNKFDENNFFS
jgi:uncharacterized protein YuzB (UPF0349 family)